MSYVQTKDKDFDFFFSNPEPAHFLEKIRILACV